MGVLAGKVALVTGATKGIGKAIVTLFINEGARVVVAARRIDDAANAAAVFGDGAMPVALEVTDRSQWDNAVANVSARWGRLDVLVNCAGITESAAIEQVSEQAWHRHMAINLDGAFHGCRAALPLMRRGGKPGSIINISSIYAQRPMPGYAAYCTSKAALTAFSKVLALECAAVDPPIRVNTVHPGGTETEMLERVIAESGMPREKAYSVFVRIHPMRRMGTAAEVAAACLWLASDASSFTTGTELNVDGGAVIRP